MKDKEKQEKAKMVQEVVEDKMAAGKDTAKEKMDKASKGKGAKDWKEDEVSMLIKLLQERPSLWDVFKNDHSKLDVKDTAYKEIAKVFGCNITSIKGKINGLRAQYGREMAKVTKTKSGQCTDELYVSNWEHYQSLEFLQPEMKSSNSKITLKQSNGDLDEIECAEVKAYLGSKKKPLAEKKIELLTKCTDAITNSTLIESQGIKRSSFTTYVEENVSVFNKRQRTITEMKTNDVLFKLPISVGNESIDRNIQPSRMFNLSRFSTAIFKILQSIKILTLWRTYPTVPQVVPQAQPT